MGKIRDNLEPLSRDMHTTFVNSRLFPRAFRSRAWNAMGHTVHSSALINADSFLGAKSNLTVGAKTFINYGCFFDLAAPTVIGERCDIGYQVMFITSTHETGDRRRRAGSAVAKPISVGSGVWIGARATILPGVSIGDGCIIGAGAVVTRDCEPNATYVGVPARLLP